MVEIWLPYGRTEVSVRVPEENFRGTIEVKGDDPLENPAFHTRRSLQSPIGSKPLPSMVKTGEKAVLVIDDAARPAIVNDLIPPVISELVGAGLRPEDITILFGANMQGTTQIEQMSQVRGAEFANRVKILNHDYRSSVFLHVGDTSHGTKVFLNEVFVKADVKILVGNVALHPYVGYTGGRTGVLPGVSGEQTVLHNHSLIAHVNARPGVIDGNPISEDMTEAAELAKVDLIINAVLNRRGQIVRVFSGNLHEAFRSAFQTADNLFKVPCESKVDVAVVSPGGTPEDTTLCRSIQTVPYALNTVKDGGAIVLVAECSHGHGNQVFTEWMGKFDKPQQFEQEIARRFAIGGQYAYLLMKALEKARVYLVSTIPDYYVSNVFKMRPGRTATAALQTALRTIGKDSDVIVIPHGASTLPVHTEHGS